MLYSETIRVTSCNNLSFFASFLRDSHISLIVSFFSHYFSHCWSWSSVVVGIAIRLRAGRSGFRVPAGARDLSLFRAFQIGSGVHLVSSSIGTLILSRGKNGRGLKFTSHVYLSAEVMNDGDQFE